MLVHFQSTIYTEEEVIWLMKEGLGRERGGRMEGSSALQKNKIVVLQKTQ
jgi:hypothetical protein